MTDDLDAIRARQDRTEGRVIVLEDDARIQKRAFADMDRDASDLRVQYGKQKKMLQALADTQSDHTKRLMRLEGKVDGLEAGMTEVKTKVTRLETGMSEVKTKVTRLESGMAKVHEGIDTIIDLLNKAS